jgi:hypothetical protein
MRLEPVIHYHLAGFRCKNGKKAINGLPLVPPLRVFQPLPGSRFQLRRRRTIRLPAPLSTQLSMPSPRRSPGRRRSSTGKVGIRLGRSPDPRRHRSIRAAPGSDCRVGGEHGGARHLRSVGEGGQDPLGFQPPFRRRLITAVAIAWSGILHLLPDFLGLVTRTCG